MNGFVSLVQNDLDIPDETLYIENAIMIFKKHNHSVDFSDYKKRCAYDTTAEISIYLSESARGQGLGTKFITLGLEKLKLKQDLFLLAWQK